MDTGVITDVDLIPAELQDRPVLFTGQLAFLLGGDETSFTGDLLRLIEKAQADARNSRRLAVAFPVQVAAWRAWQRIEPAPTHRDMVIALQTIVDDFRQYLWDGMYSFGSDHNGIVTNIANTAAMCVEARRPPAEG